MADAFATSYVVEIDGCGRVGGVLTSSWVEEIDGCGRVGAVLTSSWVVAMTHLFCC